MTQIWYDTIGDRYGRSMVEIDDRIFDIHDMCKHYNFFEEVDTLAV